MAPCQNTMPRLPQSFCIVIPAPQKDGRIPAKCLRKLNGITLIQRAINTAKRIASVEDILVATDAEDTKIISERNGVRCCYESFIDLGSIHIVDHLRRNHGEIFRQYPLVIVISPFTPLIDEDDLMDGLRVFTEQDADILVTLREERHKLWQEEAGSGCVFGIDLYRPHKKLFTEIQAFLILKSTSVLSENGIRRVMPYLLDQKAIEIASYQDWWICEKLLQRKRIVFVVRGGVACGLGHVSRALLIAHEITDHQILFLCTKYSDLAEQIITERDYKAVQQQGNLLEDVLALKPDLVINDILDSDPGYVLGLKENGVKVVCFEDSGTGSEQADLIVNALYENAVPVSDRHLYGHEYFCLRDEFLDSTPRQFTHEIRNLLLTFGGTDPSDFTRKTLEAVWPICLERGVKIYVVSGPGYVHKQDLADYIATLPHQDIEFIYATNIMSQVMEKVDIAVSAAGRTVYELAHMRIPAVIMAHHERESRHTFACERNGFINIGVMHPFDVERLRAALLRLLDRDCRRRLQERLKEFSFKDNKYNMIKRISSLL